MLRATTSAMERSSLTRFSRVLHFSLKTSAVVTSSKVNTAVRLNRIKSLSLIE
jgi:hypothetical protein